MLNIEKTENWFIVDNKFYLTNWEINNSLINLATEIWDNMNYWIKDYILINFPWEYDQEWYFIESYVWTNNKMNYVIKNSSKIAIIQNPEIIEKQEIDWIDNWLYTDIYTEKILEKMELWWDRIHLI